MSATEFLQELLRLDSTNPPGNEGPVAELLEARLSSAGFSTSLLSSPNGRPNLVARLEGPTDRPALVLLSHTDVVGVEPDRWSHDPFGGEIADGFVWGRGALDMKGVAAMHVEAAVALAQGGATPAREVIVVAVADEEAGGVEGAEWLLAHHPEAVGFGEGRPPPEVLGEGGFGLTGVVGVPLLPIVTGEKASLAVGLRATGAPGHGSMPPRNNAINNLARFVDKVAGYRNPRVHPVMREMFARLASATSGSRARAFKGLSSPVATLVARPLARPLRNAGMVGALLADTVTPTQLDAGYKNNVVPGEARGALDCRLLPDTDPDDFLDNLEKVAARFDVTIEEPQLAASPVSAQGHLYSVIEQLSHRVAPEIVVTPSLTTGTTDVRCFRQRGASGYGWVPLILDADLLATIHGHDERIPTAGFETAVMLMTDAVARAAS